MKYVDTTIEVEHNDPVEATKYRDTLRFQAGDITLDVDGDDGTTYLSMHIDVNVDGVNVEVIGYLNIEDESVARQLSAAILEAFEGGNA